MPYHHKALRSILALATLAGILSVPTVVRAASEPINWINNSITVAKISDYAWASGDQYRYGNLPCSYMDGYVWGQQTGWFTTRVKSLSNRCAVTGSSFYHAYRSIMSFDSSYWQQLDLLTTYPNPTAFANAGTDGMAIVTNSYENYWNAPVELHYVTNVLDTFSTVSADSTGNVIRKPSKPSDHTLMYPDGRTLSLSSTSGISYSSNGRWMYVKSSQVGQLRIDTQNFSVLSFAPYLNNSFGLFTAIANSGSTAATYSKDTGIRVYDLTQCQAEKPEYASRGCLSRDLTALLRSGLLQTLDNPVLMTEMYPRELKFLNESTLRVMLAYRYDGEYKTAIFSIKLDTLEPPTSYLALGDSFSSGEGVFDYIGETNFYTSGSEYNRCHLSGKSYPYILKKEIPMAWFASVACSGAVSDEIVSRSSDLNYINKLSSAKTKESIESYVADVVTSKIPGYIPQNSIVRRYSPTVATITIGGNDVGFGTIIAACITQPGCFSDRNEREKKADEIASKILGMSAKLRTVRESMGGSNPRLYVLGYPSIASPANAVCSLIGQAERERLGAMEEYLNESIKIAAHNAGAVYVDMTNTFVQSTDVDHRICGNAPAAVNGYVPAGVARSKQSTVQPGNIFGAESYHPNVLGHRLLAEKIRMATNDFQLSPTGTYSQQKRPDSSFYARFVGDSNDLFNTSTRYVSMKAYEALQRGKSFDLQIKQNSALLPSVNGQATLELHSDPITLETIAFDPAVGADISSIIPLNVAPGWHELHLLYTDIEGNEVDLYQHTYITASDDDYDGDGILNDNELCPVGGVLGIDSDGDGIDDACDAEFKKADFTTTTGTVTKSVADEYSRVVGESSIDQAVDTPAVARIFHVDDEQTGIPYRFGTTTGGAEEKISQSLLDTVAPTSQTLNQTGLDLRYVLVAGFVGLGCIGVYFMSKRRG